MKEALESCNSAMEVIEGDSSNKREILVIRGRILRHLGMYEAAVQDMTQAYLIRHDSRKCHIKVMDCFPFWFY